MSTTIVRRRGDTWTIEFTIDNGWVASQFSTLRFTLRTAYPASSVADDSDAVCQLDLDGSSDGGIEIDSGDDTLGAITVLPVVTKLLRTNYRYVWDIQATRDGTVPQQVYTLDVGNLVVTSDVTRSTT